MAPGLKTTVLLIALTLNSVALVSCAANLSTSTGPHFCNLLAGKLPVKLSRKDTPETIRQVVALNLLHQRVCHAEANP
jgi:hypothetical protein